MDRIFTLRNHAIVRTLLLTFLTVGALHLGAQIPNAGFENWTNSGAGWEPDDWETGNTSTVTQVTRSDDAFEGLYSMRVEAQPMGVGSYGYAETSFPMTAIPASLDFYVRAFHVSGFSSVTVGFYNEDVLFEEFEWITSDTLDAWTPVVLELEQNEPVLTEARIRVETHVGDLVPGEAILWVDAMGFETITATEDADPENITVYPNPCDQELHLRGAKIGTRYVLSDITGREVAQGQTTDRTTTLDVSDLTSGIYLMKLGRGAGEEVRKVVVK